MLKKQFNPRHKLSQSSLYFVKYSPGQSGYAESCRATPKNNQVMAVYAILNTKDLVSDRYI